MNELYAFIWSKPFKHLWLKCLLLRCRPPVTPLHVLISFDGQFVYNTLHVLPSPSRSLCTPWMRPATSCSYGVSTAVPALGFIRLLCSSFLLGVVETQPFRRINAVLIQIHSNVALSHSLSSLFLTMNPRSPALLQTSKSCNPLREQRERGWGGREDRARERGQRERERERGGHR